MYPERGGRYYLDCEFDGHNGPLLSLALVGENDSIHIRTTERAQDPWVIENVEPHMSDHDAGMDAEVPLNEVGITIASFFSLMRDVRPTIIADSVVDIGRFCRALSTQMDGEWSAVDYPLLRFEVHDVAAYPTDLPGAVQHNAWWDAMALQRRLSDGPAGVKASLPDDATGAPATEGIAPKSPAPNLRAMARAHYEAWAASMVADGRWFTRWATWEECCEMPGWEDQKIAAMAKAVEAGGG